MSPRVLNMKLCLAITFIATMEIQVDAQTSIHVSKCCKSGEVLNIQNMSMPTCTKQEDGDSVWEQIQALDRNNPEELVTATLEQALVDNIPNCNAGFEAFELHEGMITLDGKVAIRNYVEFYQDKDNFCIDRDFETNKLTVLVCDACKENTIACIQLCCPPGQTLVEYWNETVCEDHETTQHGDLSFSSHDGSALTTGRRNEQYILVAPQGPSFECDERHELDGIYVHWAAFFNDSVDTFNLIDDGKLRGLIQEKDSGNKTTNFWEPQEFCIAQTNESIGEYEFFLCRQIEGAFEEEDACDTRTATVHSVFLIISIIFLLITFAVHLIVPSFKKQYLFRNITMAFLVNLIIAYIILVNSNLTEMNYSSFSYGRSEETECIVEGYLILYFYLTFLFWINAMSFNIYQKFSKMFNQTNGVRDDNLKFLGYFAYAQGVPLLIVIITAIVDSQAPDIESGGDTRYFPNMGIYRCFVGYSKQDLKDRAYFVQSPEFIYFHVYLVIIQIANIYFFVVSSKSIHSAFVLKANLREAQEKEKDNSMLKKELIFIGQLFTITGLWWIFELISAYVGWVSDEIENCGLLIFLNVPNLLSGVLIFLATVCKRSVLVGLQERLGLTIIKDKTLVSESTVTKNTNLSSTAK